MNLLKSFEFVPGVKWFEGEMHDSLFQHSVFGAIIFLVVSNTEVYKFVKDTIFSVSGVKLDGNTLQLVHAVVFAVIMYFGSLFILAPLLSEGLTEGLTCDDCDDFQYAQEKGMNETPECDLMCAAQICDDCALEKTTDGPALKK